MHPAKTQGQVSQAIAGAKRVQHSMSKPTYTEIARLAGVGTATVERVLNGRGGVGHKTAEKVVQAARKLDWPGRLPERHRGITRIEVMLVRPETSFFARLSRAFRRISASLDPSIQIQITFVDESDPLGITERLLNPAAPRSALVISAPDHPLIHAAVTRVVATAIPVVQVVSQPVEGAHVVGIDNLAVGRMAGMMMARLGAVRGTVVAMCHSPVYQLHRQRIRGFSDYLHDHANPDLKFAYVCFGQDRRSLSAALLRKMFEEWPDLAGFYNAGGGNSGVLETLRHARRKVFFVGHELSESTRAALNDGIADVIFDQHPEAQARRAIDIILSRLGIIEFEVDDTPIRFTTMTAENI